MPNFDNLITLEPRTPREKYKACVQNSLEVLLLIATYSGSLISPSFVSIAFAVLNHIFLITSHCEKNNRLRYGKRGAVFGLIMLAGEICWKFDVMAHMVTSFSSKEAL